MNPLVLYALAAAAIPLIIHLLNRRKFKQIKFSSIEFLKQLEKKQMRNLRIRQLLLLLIRTLIVTCLVLAFARPTLQEQGGAILSDRSNIEAVILIDNSMSLNEAQLSGTVLDRLRAKFGELQKVFQPGDRITVIQATQPMENLVPTTQFSEDVWETALKKLQPNFLKSNISDAFEAAIPMLTTSPYAGKELYVLSDYQISGFDLKQIQKTITSTNSEPFQKIFHIPLFHDLNDNLSVDSIAIINRLIEKNQPIEISAFITNHHPDKYLNTMVSVILNDVRVEQQQINLAPKSRQHVVFKLTLTTDGFVEGYVEIDPDNLIEDNRQYFNFYVPPKLSVLHLKSQQLRNSFVPFILQPAIEKGIFTLKQQSENNWSSENFTNYNVIILEGIDQISPALNRRIKNFVENGGGVLLIPGKNINTTSYQSLLSALNLGKMSGNFGNPAVSDQFLSVDAISWTHPVFEGLFEQRPNRLNPIEVYAGYRLLPLAGSNVLIRLSDRTPLLMESRLGKGSAFFLASPLQNDWNQLPSKGFVVPLLYRICYYGGVAGVSERHTVLTGGIFQSQFWNLEAPYQFQIVGPQNLNFQITPTFSGTAINLNFSKTIIPGNYKLMHNDKQIASISVNHWPEESFNQFYTSEQLESHFPNAYLLNDNQPLEEQVKQFRSGKELWQYFVGLALLLLLLEMVISRTGSKREYSKSVTNSHG